MNPLGIYSRSCWSCSYTWALWTAADSLCSRRSVISVIYLTRPATSLLSGSSTICSITSINLSSFSHSSLTTSSRAWSLRISSLSKREALNAGVIPSSCCYVWENYWSVFIISSRGQCFALVWERYHVPLHVSLHLRLPLLPPYSCQWMTEGLVPTPNLYQQS